MKILVAGGLRPEFKEGNTEEVCARALGRAIATSGHVLLNGSYNTLDRLLAEAADRLVAEAADRLVARGGRPPGGQRRPGRSRSRAPPSATPTLPSTPT